MSKISSLSFFYRLDNHGAARWEQKIRKWLTSKYPRLKIGVKKPDALLVLGGDGTILEAARLCQKTRSIIVGLNLGTVGFLSSVRDERQFLHALEKLLSGDFHVIERTMIAAQVVRKGKTVFRTTALNEIAVLNPLGMVEIEVKIGGQAVQYIHGTGALVATATGSTAYNLSLHGPIVLPGLSALVLTEISDHNIPTPPVVFSDQKQISFRILNFRERGLLSVTATGQTAEVLLVSDGEVIFPLNAKDEVKVTRSGAGIVFAEFEKNQFLKSLQEKFAFK